MRKFTSFSDEELEVMRSWLDNHIQLLGGIFHRDQCISLGVCSELDRQLTQEKRFRVEEKESKNVSDNLGNTWGPCPECGNKMQVVRPGKAQCVTEECSNLKEILL